MAADPRLLAVLSHELRSPMGVLSGYLKLLDREPGLTERQQTLVRNALKAGDKLQDLLGELRDLLQLEAGDLRPERRAAPLQTLVADVVSTSAAFPETPTVLVGLLPNVVLQNRSDACDHGAGDPRPCRRAPHRSRGHHPPAGGAG